MDSSETTPKPTKPKRKPSLAQLLAKERQAADRQSLAMSQLKSALIEALRAHAPKKAHQAILLGVRNLEPSLVRTLAEGSRELILCQRGQCQYRYYGTMLGCTIPGFDRARSLQALTLAAREFGNIYAGKVLFIGTPGAVQYRVKPGWSPMELIEPARQ